MILVAILASYVLPASKITTDLIHLYLTKVKNAFNVFSLLFEAKYPTVFCPLLGRLMAWCDSYWKT